MTKAGSKGANDLAKQYFDLAEASRIEWPKTATSPPSSLCEQYEAYALGGRMQKQNRL